MRTRFLLFLSLGAALISAVLMLYVAYHGNKARSSISQYGIGVFNYTNQNTGNLSQFITAISDYRGEQDVEKKAAFKKEYLKRFDILWSAFVTLQQFQKDRTWPEISEFVTNSRQFALDADSLMKPDVQLSETHIQSLLKSTRELRQQNINLSNRHFQRQSSLRDDAAIRIRLLNRAYAALGAVLGIAVGSFLLLLWRARKRELKSTEELRTAHEQLTRVVEELRSGKVERKAQNRFVAAASHDLRQPLHALGLFLNSLEKNIHEPEGLRLLDKIRQSTSALNGLFNSLLDISRLDAGVVEVKTEHFDLQALLNEVKEEFSEAARERNVDMLFGNTDEFVFTDRLLLHRILRNLVRNSLTHAPGSALNVFVRGGSKPEGGGILLEIVDDGPGIPAAEHNEIFSEYYQLNNPERDRNKGLGLGLSIVRRLTELLKLKMDFESSPGRGARFLLYLPAGDSSLAADRAEPFNGSLGKKSLGKLQVLVIDDEQDIRDGMAITFSTANCDVITSESGEAARKELVERDVVPDIIIADYRLRDGLTGSDAVYLIREEMNQEIPALIVTGDTSAERVKEASESGMRLLHKPVVPAELLQTMKDILEENKVDTGQLPVVRAEQTML